MYILTIILQMLVLAILPTGYGPLFCMLITLDKTYSGYMPLKKNVFFYMWLIQWLLWCLLIFIME